MIFSFLSILSLLMPSGTPVESPFDLIVEVRPTTGNGLPAEVRITLDRDAGHQSVALASNQGIARFNGLAHGQYWVTVEAEGYQSSRVEFSAGSSRGNEHLTVDLGPPLSDEPTPVEIVDYRALRLSPRALEYWEKAGKSMAENRYDEALESLEQVARIEPDFTDAHRTLGAISLQLRKWDQAEIAFQKAAKLEPESYQRHLDLGYFYLHVGQADGAIAPLQKAVELRPENAGIRAFLGDALRLTGRIEESIIHLEKAVALDPTLGLALHSVGLAYLDLNRLEQALQSFRALLQTESAPDSVMEKVKKLVSELENEVEADKGVYR